jgi:hypothetical protein
LKKSLQSKHNWLHHRMANTRGRWNSLSNTCNSHGDGSQGRQALPSAPLTKDSGEKAGFRWPAVVSGITEHTYIKRKKCDMKGHITKNVSVPLVWQ